MRPLDAEMPKQADQTRLNGVIPVSRHPSLPEFEGPYRLLAYVAGASTLSAGWQGWQRNASCRPWAIARRAFRAVTQRTRTRGNEWPLSAQPRRPDASW